MQSTIEGLWRARELPRQHVADAGTGTGFSALDEVLADRGWPQAGLVELLCEDCGIGELRLLSPALATLASTDKRCIAWINPPHLPYPPALQTAGIDPSRVLLVRVQDHADALWAFEQACKSGACCAVLGWLEPSAGEREGPAPRMEEPSAGEREGLAPRMREPSAGEREGPAPRMEEPSAGEREGLAPRMKEPREGLAPRKRAPKLRFTEIRRLQFAAKQGRTWANLFRPVAASREASAAELRLRLRALPEDRLNVDIVKRRGGWPLSGIEIALGTALGIGLTQRRRHLRDELQRWRRERFGHGIRLTT